MQKFVVGDFHPHLEGNSIRTSFYTKWNCLPKFQYSYFVLPVNLYFLIVAAIQHMEQSPVGSSTQLFGIIMIQIVLCVKSVIEDVQRHRFDRAQNGSPVNIYCAQSKSFVVRKASEIKVGDILLVRDKQTFPSDVVILESSHTSGIAYVSTANLDGESELKPRSAFNKALITGQEPIHKKEHRRGLSVDLSSNHDLDWIQKCEVSRSSPQRSISQIKVSINGHEVDQNSLMFRGCVLKNTAQVTCLVTYGGNSTIMMQNTGPTIEKRSRVDRETDRILFIMIAFSHLMSVIMTSIKFAQADPLDVKNADLTFTSFIVSYLANSLILTFLTPISLYAAKIVVQALQVFQIQDDKGMDCSAKVMRYPIIAELGSIKYIVSDKTGTLTQNKMVFRKALYMPDAEKLDFLEMPECSSESEQVERIKEIFNQNEHLQHFLMCILVCQDAYIDRGTSGDESNYLCTNQDESALLNALKHLPAQMTDKSMTHLIIDIFGETIVYERTKLGIAFDSAHKYMIEVVRKDDTYFAYTKGAVENLMPMIDPATVPQQLDEYLMQCYKECYRVMCMCYAKFDHAPTQDELRATGRHTFTGCSAIEDMLDEGVAETIAKLVKAGIRIFIATGDNPYTAQNIAFKCGHVIPNLDFCVLDPEQHRPGNLNLAERDPLVANEYVIMDSAMVREALGHPKLFIKYMGDGKGIFSRVEPSQKAQIVQAFKDYGGKSTLAIGDGANDCRMITTANVGVGIVGKEGKLAAAASDFSITRFKHLALLILLHGAWNYDRIVKGILYFIYKNILFVVPAIIFLFSVNFRNLFLYPAIAAMLFTVLFSSFVILALSAFQYRISSVFRMEYPQLYRNTLEKNKLETLNVLGWICNGIIHGLIIYFIINKVVSDGFITAYGNQAGINYMSFATMLTCIVVIMLKAAIESYQISGFTSIFLFSPLFFFMAYVVIFTLILPHYGLYARDAGIFYEVFATPQTYYLVLIIVTLSLMRDVLWKLFKRQYWRLEDLTYGYEQGLNNKYEHLLFKQLVKQTKSAAKKTNPLKMIKNATKKNNKKGVTTAHDGDVAAQS